MNLNMCKQSMVQKFLEIILLKFKKENSEVLIKK